MNRELILAIESSCDETSVAVVENGTKILSNIVASQINSHKRFGGVVPEVASRHHVEQITLCIDEALAEAEVTVAELSAVAVTYGPGLVGSLLIGISAAKAFAWANNLPLIPVNHMAGHIYAARFVKPFEFPLIALLVSGGHTELVYMQEDGSYEIIGETRDDAAGEAYDKVGRVLGLSYPSGKEIDELAHHGKDNYHFPRAMIHEANYDFSFSGLKSAFINLVHNAEQRGEELDKNDLAASFQASVVEVLVTKTLRACKEFPVKQLVVAGGVAANQGLREGLATALAKELPEVELIIPPLRLCGDNAAMIGAAAHVERQKGTVADLQLNANPSLVL
ncbi:tRNA (adenosine(37)-N6)-threonylcarbamoyltransferase complex transferase subunit TsaD [Enterococcus thailandicus]|uniref:tRNA (adenosine(37)-N6)-threonylcarbamoyltransferase complex transferase subunit TsaD n=1 Tax=Enterococcus thailandicus TaxID=417368 RepID=UPI0022EBCD17|nr:tRNA (adenosine(37)-N6)-threonylcarbamoyltransferase complex transferase subunit TsaD [Enterococcus thailandicus]MDA3974358.1 tRNA (adenosine(37)-N6)-threonylcarbamoyltransferase complex transferase subunit TsaD [Enterococcus thailandicus]MDA3976845.1 tRNA (adenosine(37)-N6)-threonylcarbamoyltransferase complex transferase subunit TsaD [Enterococcus thailandicus]MDA3981811.1 tRNA (adenosine(37)-N6)-threonylcarbamoyltransferase complex transferase subunit TsaD [Enterococcus thailandicus]